MNRRQLMALAAATAAATALPRIAVSGDFVPYTRGAFDAAVASGRPVLLDAYANW